MNSYLRLINKRYTPAGLTAGMFLLRSVWLHCLCAVHHLGGLGGAAEMGRCPGEGCQARGARSEGIVPLSE